MIRAISMYLDSPWVIVVGDLGTLLRRNMAMKVARNWNRKKNFNASLDMELIYQLTGTHDLARKSFLPKMWALLTFFSPKSFKLTMHFAIWINLKLESNVSNLHNIFLCAFAHKKMYFPTGKNILHYHKWRAINWCLFLLFITFILD